MSVLHRSLLRRACGLALLGTALLAGCDAFAPRTPETPGGASGGFEQPDTPERVVANLVRALANLDPTAYRRSLAEPGGEAGAGFRFTPTPEAAARAPGLWAGWDAGAEDAYFRTLVAAAAPGAAFTLRLADQSPPEVTDRRYVLDASYVLTTPHRRPEAPTSVQGRLRWTITRGADGLWARSDWQDRSLGAGTPSWSDLKAAFSR